MEGTGGRGVEDGDHDACFVDGVGSRGQSLGSASSSLGVGVKDLGVRSRKVCKGTTKGCGTWEEQEGGVWRMGRMAPGVSVGFGVDRLVVCGTWEGLILLGLGFGF